MAQEMFERLNKNGYKILKKEEGKRLFFNPYKDEVWGSEKDAFEYKTKNEAFRARKIYCPYKNVVVCSTDVEAYVVLQSKTNKFLEDNELTKEESLAYTQTYESDKEAERAILDFINTHKDMQLKKEDFSIRKVSLEKLTAFE